LEAILCVGGQVDLRSVADRGGRVHASILGEEFEELRVACRRLWEERLSPEAFFANFHRHLEVKIFRAEVDSDFHPNTRTLVRPPVR
jgi:hypothetical protein